MLKLAPEDGRLDLRKNGSEAANIPAIGIR